MNLTKHFLYKELNPHMLPCKDFVVLSLIQLALFLEVVRWTYGKPIRVTSGFRNEYYNNLCGGVKDSMHLLGKAVDIAPMRSNSTEQYEKDFESLCFHVTRSNLPKDAFIRIYQDRKFIHIHFGERDETPLNLLPYFPFTKV